MGKRVFISKHARDRIRERGADKDFVQKVVFGRVRRSRLNSDRPDCVIYTAWDANGVAWSVVVYIKKNIILTVREADEKERENYARKYQA